MDSFRKKNHTTKSPTNKINKIYQFKAKLLFENLIHISPQDIEDALNIKDPCLKLPPYLDLLDLKIRTQTEEDKLRQVLNKGLHSGQSWAISKYLSFLYMICANIFLTRNIYQKFILFYMKALHVIEPPTKDSNWPNKSEWKVLRVLAGTHISLYYCKNDKINDSVQILCDLNNIMTELEKNDYCSKILYHIYASLGLLEYKLEKYDIALINIKKGIINLRKFIHIQKVFNKTNDKDLFETYKEEIKNKSYCKLIYLYLKYKLCKIQLKLNLKEESLLNLKEAKEIANIYKQKINDIEEKDLIIDYICLKLDKLNDNITKYLRNEIIKDIKAGDSNQEKDSIKNKLNRNNNELTADKLLYRIRRTKSTVPLIEKPIKIEKIIDSEEKKMELNKIYQKQELKNTFHKKTYSSSFTIIQKPSDKIGKVYELLGRPNLKIEKKKDDSQNTTNDSKSSQSNSIWKKIKSFKEETEMTKQREQIIFQQKRTKILFDLKQSESSQITLMTEKDKIKLNILTNKLFTKKKPKKITSKQIDPLISELVCDIEDLNKSESLKFELNEAEQIINDFFKIQNSKSEHTLNIINTLNTITSAGELDERGEIPLSSRLDKNHSSKMKLSGEMKNDSDKTVRSRENLLNPSISPTKSKIFGLDNFLSKKNEDSLKTLQRFIKRKLNEKKIFKQNVLEEEKSSKLSPDIKLENLIVKKPNLSKFESFTDLNKILSEMDSPTKSSMSPEKRHKSHLINLQDLLRLYRKPITIKIHNNFMLYKLKPKKPKISVLLDDDSHSEYGNSAIPRQNSILLSPNSPKKANEMYSSFFNKSKFDTNLKLDISMDFSVKSQKSNQSIEKSNLNIISPTKIIHGVHNLKNKAMENKKKLETKQGINQLSYISFYFNKIIEGKLYKWKVKYENTKTIDQIKKVIFNIQTTEWLFQFEIPSCLDIEFKKFVDYQTVWPIIYQSFLDWNLKMNFINNAEFEKEILSYNFNLQANKGLFMFENNTKSINIKLIDIQACCKLSLLFELLLGNYFIICKKMNGEVLKFIGHNMKELLIFRNIPIIKNLKKTKNELKKILFKGFCFEVNNNKIIERKLEDKFEKIYSKETKNLLKEIYKQPSCILDLKRKIILEKLEKNLFLSYRKELILILHKKLQNRFILIQLIKKDLFNNLYWNVLICITGLLSKKEENSDIFDGIDLNFIIKIFCSKNQKNHVNQETLGSKTFEKQLKGSVTSKQILLQYLFNDKPSKLSRKQIYTVFNEDLTIVDSKIKLKHYDSMKAKLDEAVLFQQNFKSINKLSLFKKRKAEISDPLSYLFESVFEEIYAKDFANKREENFESTGLDDLEDSDSENENNKEQHIRLKNQKYGHLEIIQEEEDFIAHEEIITDRARITQSTERSDKTDVQCHLQQVFEIERNIFYLKIRFSETDLLYINFKFKYFENEQKLFVKIYHPLRRIISRCSVEEEKTIFLILNTLVMNSPKAKELQLLKLINLKPKAQGFIYCTNSKKERDFAGPKKNIILSSDISLKSNLIKNSEEIKKKFDHKTYHFILQLSKLGKCVVSMSLYLKDELVDTLQDNSLMICFQISSFNSRTKALKLILNKEDIEVLFFKIDNEITLNSFLRKIQDLLQNLTFLRQKLYSLPHYVIKKNLRLNLTRSYSTNKIVKKQQQDLSKLKWYKNRFLKHDLGKSQTNINKGFFEEYIHDSRLIGQFIKKIKFDFMVVTIWRHLILDYWIVNIYLPKTARSYVCYISNSDLLFIDIYDLLEIYPKEIAEKWSEKKGFYVSFEEFSNSFQRKNFSIKNIKKNERNKKENENAEIHNDDNVFVNSFRKKKMRKVMKIKDMTNVTEKMNDSFIKGVSHPRIQNLYSFIELYIWEGFVKKIEIKQKDENTFFTIKKFKAQLKQVLFSSYVKIDKNNDAFIEIFLNVNREKESIFSTFEPISYAATSNHNILIRYISLNKLSIQIEKINLREIINLFIADGFYKFQTNYMNSKFYLADLQNLCNFIIFKIKSSNFANLIHDNMSKKKHHASKSAQYFRRTINTDENSIIPTIKDIFSKEPEFQIITYSFYLDDKILGINVYQPDSGFSLSREYKFYDIADNLPFFYFLLENEEYREICKRLLKIIKNILSIDVNFEFMLLNSEEEDNTDE